MNTLTIIGIVIGGIVASYIIQILIGLLCYVYSFLIFYKKDKSYKGKHVIIFGGSQGVGKALAIRLSKQGIKLTIAARKEQFLKETQEECNKQNSETECIYFICDMCKTEDVKKTLKNSIKKFGLPSLMINSAGIAHPGYLNSISYEQYEKDMNLNYFGNLRMYKEFKEIYENYLHTGNVEHDDDSTNNEEKQLIQKIDKDKMEMIDIVSVGSVFGLIGSLGYTAYNPTKYAVKGLTDCLRFEFLNRNIRLHYYAPSNMETPGFEIENQNKPVLVRQMEDNVKTISADQAAHYLLCNMDQYCITTEADLEVLKNATSFMNTHNLRDLLMAPISSVIIAVYRYFSIERNIRTNKEYMNDLKKMD